MSADLDEELAKFAADIEAIESCQKKVVVKKPKVISAPPKRRFEATTGSSTGSSSWHHNQDTTTPAALSGFLPGTSGEAAIESTSFAKPMLTSLTNVSRVDMATGQPLTADEQHRMNLQQSVYEYDPNRKEYTKGPINPASIAENLKKRRKQFLRAGGGTVWEDLTLAEWAPSDFRLFCGNLGNEVSDELLCHSFSQYPSFQKAKVCRDKGNHKTRGYGFVSFSDGFDCAKALREMNGKYIGNRPVKLTKSKWKERNFEEVKKKVKEKNKFKKKKSKHLF